jgi:anaerobic magnesium-protoporphyrin IX monomethyl ester cyclase
VPRLGLFAVGGALIYDGHDVALLDREFGPVSRDALVAEIAMRAPDAVLFDHLVSPRSQPVIRDVAARAATALPRTWIVYGGVYPTCCWREILREEPYVDAIVRGEGRESARGLMRALEAGGPLDAVRGIAFRDGEWVFGTPPMVVELVETRRKAKGSGSTRVH